MTTLQIVQDILQEQLAIEIQSLTPEAIFTDLGADSLDMVEIIMTCESEFPIDIPDEIAATIRTIQDLVTIIDNKIP